MKIPPILFLYGIDEHSHTFEIDSTLALVRAATLALSERGWRVLPLQISHDFEGPLKPYAPKEWLVFNMCEGSPHQEFYYAKATRMLDALGYVYTGSDSWSLNETQYKWKMKRLLDDANVPTPKWAVTQSAETLHFDAFPAIVKPAAEHCSYGITRDSVVMNLDEARKQAAKLIEEYNAPILIEEFLDSEEYNVSVWGLNHDASVLGISMMTYDAFGDIHDRLCTFDAKWTPESEAYQKIPAICPAPLSPELKAKIEAVSVAAYAASGVRDYGRIDLRLRNGEPMALDVNANCGLNSDDGFMNAARIAGLGYGEMLERIIQFAIQRGRTQQPVAETLVEVVV
ncbi:MAG: ATP-grasp domain-containing protein [Anaerolineae bacterium]|nr:ATP-grasp domain-containing protein [Anaerolineae bacterium]